MKRFTRTLAFILAFTMVLGYLPQNLVFADAQKNINDLRIETTTGSNIIKLAWSRPDALGNGETSDTTALGKHQANSYSISMRDASKQENTNAYQPAPNSPLLESGIVGSSKRTFDISTNIFDKGKLYMFKVIPSHKHSVTNPITQETTWVDAPLEGTKPEEILYLSDIAIVDAYGTGESLTIKLTNPRFNDLDVFPYYRITYVKGIKDNEPWPTNADATITIPVNDPRVIRDDNRNELTITLSGEFDYSAVYGIRVEPLNADQKSPREQKVDRITVGGSTYKFFYSNNEYSSSVRIKPQVWVEEANNMLKVSWTASINSDIISISVLKSTDPDFATYETIITYQNDYKNYMPFVYVPKPTDYSTLYFKVRIEYRTSDGSTDESLSDRTDGYSPKDIDYKAYMPEITEAKLNISNPMLAYDISWKAFLHGASDESGTPVADRKMKYEVVITDSMSNFDNQNISNHAVIIDVEDKLDDAIFNFDGEKNIYTNTFSQYISPDNNFVPKDFEENKVYYIRIRAIRKTETENVSVPAYYSWYIYPTGNIPSTPVMISKPPLKLAEKDTDKLVIQWNLKWFEVYDDKTEAWYSMVGKDASGNIVYGDKAQGLPKVLRLNDIKESDLEDIANKERSASDYILNYLGINSDMMLPVRQMDLTGSDYAIHVVPFDEMTTKGGYDTYYNKELLPLESKASMWEFVLAKDIQTNPPTHTIDKLSSNTAYVVYFLPFIFNKDRYLLQYPSYLVETTLVDRDDVIIDPTVPFLLPVASDALSVTVKWAYSPELSYELKYSELIADYEGKGGTSISIDSDAKVSADGVYQEYTVTGLFPNTKYYFWLYSKSGDNTSPPSTAIDQTTTDIAAPPKPKLGSVSPVNLEIYNTENDVDYLQSDYDYIIVEWSEVFYPGATSNTSGTATSGNLSEILTSPMFKDIHIVKFNQLVANGAYHVRAKTKLTVVGGSNGVSLNLSYVIQIADNPEFLDAYEIEVPSAPIITGNGKVLQKESDDWDYFSQSAVPSDGNFDGDKPADTFPLPTEDFEKKHDDATGTLTYRFHSGQSDKGGYMVEQRFISKLVQTNAFSYYIDLSSYGDKAIINRKIEIPYSIVTALDEMKINLEVIVGNASVTFYPNWIQTSEVKALTDFGATSTVYINFSENASKVSANTGGSYVSTPQQLTINVKTATRTQLLNTTASPMSVSLKLNNRYATYDKNVLACQYTDSAGAWQTQASTYDPLTGQMNFKTMQLGTYAAIAKNASVAATSHYANDAMQNFATKMTVTDMNSYNGNTPISSNQLNNLVAAIATGKKEFEINGSLSPTDVTSLSRSKLLTETDNITREQGVASLVKLYEIKTGSAIKNFNSMATTPYVDIFIADSTYQNSLLKAGDLGFFAEGAARPKDRMTLGDAIYIADLILQDMGL